MHPDDDPFAAADADRTLIVPPAGARAPDPWAGPPGDSGIQADAFGGTAAAALDPAAAHADPARTAAAGGLNPLVGAADPLLAIVTALRATPQVRDVAALRARLAQAVGAFEARAAAAGVPPRQVLAARYVLCTLLDEAAASTPWGGSGAWAAHSLLASFHNETWGGEKVFRLLAKLAEDPAANRDLLELLYVCLALGFEGRYRVAERGPEQLAGLRERLAALLRRHRAPPEPELSARWQPVARPGRRLPAVLPSWVVLAACGALLLGTYVWLAQRLDREASPVYARILALGTGSRAPAPAPAAAPEPQLAGLLAPEIARGQLALRGERGATVLTLGGDGLFAPGSATLAAGREPLLARVAQALAAVPGPVLVTGHSDDTPIMSARFASNWHLSQERAGSVARRLQAHGLPAQRVRAEGRADAEPIAPNDTPAGRARNRRVEIALTAARPAALGEAR